MTDLYETIERYLDGEMPPDERLEFETELRSDTELAATLATVREVRMRLTAHWASDAAQADLKKTLLDLRQQHRAASPPVAADFSKKNTPTPLRITWQRVLAVAASVALVVAATVWMLRPQMDERLYAHYRDLPEADFTLRGTADDVQHQLERGGTAFNQKNYDEALTAFRAALALQPEHTEAQFFAALCLLEKNDMLAAEALLAPIVNSTNVWASEARWYLALSMLRRHDRVGCAAQLQQIGTGERRYADAQTLLEKLR
jgi:tetratricopeptide (TPR) repeat protein